MGCLGSGSRESSRLVSFDQCGGMESGDLGVRDHNISDWVDNVGEDVASVWVCQWVLA